MGSLGPEQLVFMIPIAAILGGLAYGAVELLFKHRERVEQMRAERAQAQAEVDRELIGGVTASPHLDAILERLNAIEERLEEMRSEGQGTASPSPTARRSVMSAESEEQERDRREERDVQVG